MKETVLQDEGKTAKLLDEFLGELCREFGDESWVLLGIHRRGDILAERLRQRISREKGREAALGVLDITLYRDDFTPGRPQPVVRPSRIPFDVDDASILLIDDVFQTGRTIRAALQQIADFGRPRRVVLATFIDRRMRELPICPDVVGITVDRGPEERVQLRLAELDGRDEIVAQRVGEHENE